MKSNQNIRLLVGFLVVFFFFSAPVAFGANAPAWTPEQKEVISIMEAWEKAYHGSNLDDNIATLGGLLAEEIDITSGTFKGTFKSKVSYLEAYRKWFAFSRTAAPDTSITYAKVEISGDSATVVRRIEWSSRGDRGLRTGTLTKTATLQKIEGRWKVYSEK